MATRTTTIQLRADIGDFLSKMDAAAKAAGGVGPAAAKGVEPARKGLSALAQSARDNEQDWRQLGGVLTGIGAAAAVGVGAAVKAYADYDAAMSKVRAATHETEANMALLGDAAIKAGADTVFSATEAAGAIEELAKAGVSTKDILGGGLDGALDLAAAGSIEVGQAAEIAATAMTQFGLEGAKVPHIADLLAAGAGKAQGGVHELGEALKQSGLVAAQTGLTIEETTGGLSAFASAGLLGSDAGTSFKTMLQSLTPQSKAAQEAMESIGFSAYDANGNFVGLTEVAGRLQAGLADMSVEQQNATLKTIFGSDAVRAAAVLYQQGAEGIQGWIDKTNDAGYAAETAALNMDNLRGDLEGLAGSLETALIGTGESADGPLRAVVQALDDVVDAYNGLGDGAKGAVLGVGGITAAVGLAAGAFVSLVPRVVETYDAFRRLVPAGSRASGILKDVGKAAAVAGGIVLVAQGLVAVADALSDDGTALRANALADAIERMGDGDLSSLDEQFRNFEEYVGGTNVDDLASAFDRLFDKTALESFTDGLDNVMTSIPVLGDLAQSEVSRVTERFTGLDQQLASMASGGSLDEAQAGFERIKEAALAQGVSLEQLNTLFPEYNDALIGAEKAQDDAADAALRVANGVKAVGEAGLYVSLDSYIAGLGLSEEAAKVARDQIVELGETMLGFTEPAGVYSGLLAAKQEAEEETARATADATESQSDSWEDYVGDVRVSAAEYIDELEKQQRAQQDWQTNMLRLASRVSEGTLEQLARMGPEGAPLVADLVNASDAELQRLDDVFASNAEDATFAWGEKLRYAGPVLAEIAKTAGQGAADAAATALANGTKTIEEIASEYGVAIAKGVNPVLVSLGKKPIAGKDGRQGGLLEADGGVVDYYANGTEDHTAQIAPAGAWRVWAEDETGGEAYIPLAASKRSRSIDIWKQTGRRLGVDTYSEQDVQQFADGGITAPPSFSPYGNPTVAPAKAGAQRMYDEAKAFLDAQAAAQAAAGVAGDMGPIPPAVGGWVRPIRGGIVTSEYGPRGGRMHSGIDISTGGGATIMAARAGRVKARKYHSSWGNHVQIQHDTGMTNYAHMVGPGIVSPGQTVAAGQALGREGNTGNSFGAHLHFEWSPNGSGRINPRNLPIRFANGGIAGAGENHEAQTVTGTRTFGEPETGGEAYIPLAAHKRSRSLMVLQGVASQFGFTLSKMGGASYGSAAAQSGYAATGSAGRGGLTVNQQITSTEPAAAGRESAARMSDTLNILGL